MFREYDKPYCQNVRGDFSNTVRDLKPDGQGGWLLLTNPLCASGQPYRHYDWVLTKLDGAFEVIWSRQYGHPTLNDMATKILVEPDGYVLAGGLGNHNATPINFTHRAQLIKTDTAGNVLWTWLSDASKKVYSATDVVRTADGGYVYCGTTGIETLSANQAHGIVRWKGWVEKLDANRNPQWNKVTSDIHTSMNLVEQRVIRLLPNGDVVIGGSIVDSLPSPNWGKHYGLLTHISPSGLVRWQRRYSFAQDTFQYFMHDMRMAPDGGFVMVGQCVDPVAPYNPPTQQGWIIKVDSNGCQSTNDPQCWPASITPVVSKKAAALVYPNPANKVLNVRYTRGAGAVASIQVYDMLGRKALEAELGIGETTLDITKFRTGIYLWRILHAGTEADRGKFIKE